MRLISEVAKGLGRREGSLRSLPSSVFKSAALAFATLTVTVAQAQTGPAGLTFFGNNVVRESINSSAPVTQLAVGYDHSVGIRADGTVVAWGLDASGQCDIPKGMANAVQAAAGANHTLILKSDGSIFSCGDNIWSQLPPPGIPPAIQVVAGTVYSAAIMADHTVQVWGSSAPTPPLGLGNVSQLAAGGSHCLALVNGAIVGWGADGFQQASGGQGLTGVKYIAACGDESGAILADGSIKVWGNGFATSGVPAGKGFIQLSVGYTSAMAIKSDHSMVIWGSPSFNLNSPPMGALGTNIAQVATYHQSAFVVTQDGNVVGWGDPANGHTTIPAHMYDLQSMGAGWQHVVFLKHDGTLLAWGDNSKHQCDVPSPPAGKKFTALTVGYKHAAAFGAGISVSAGLFGDNSDNQLNVPASLPTVDTVWAAGNTTYAHLLTGGTAAWGLNIDGELGLSSPTFNPSLVTGGDSDVLAIAQGAVSGVGTNGAGQLTFPGGLTSGITQVSILNNQFLALKGQQVIAWGNDNWHQTEIPNAVTSANIVQVSAGWEHSLALGQDGAVYAWGANYNKQAPAPAGLTGQAQIAASGWFNVTMPKVQLNVVPFNLASAGVGVGTVYIPQSSAQPTTINLASTSQAVYFDMPTVTIPAGKTSATFNVHANAVLNPLQVLITATLGNCVQTSMVTVTPPAFAISTNVPSVVGGSTTALTLNLTLASPAPAGGADVIVASNDPTLVPPASVHFNGGATTPATPPIVVATKLVTASKTVSLSGTYQFQTISCKVNVLPFQLQNFTIVPSTKLAGMAVLGSVQLNATPASQVTVSFTSSNTALLANLANVPFTSQIQTVSFQSFASAAPASITITGNLNGSLSTTFTLNQTFGSIVFSSPTWYGASHTVVTAYLSQPAGSGGLTVNLSTDSNCMSPTSTLFFPNGSTSAGNVSITGNDVALAVAGKVTVSLGNVSLSNTKTIIPNGITQFVATPSTFSASGNPSGVTLTVGLNAVVDYDVYVNIVSSNTSLVSSPGSVKIPKGKSSVTIPLNHATSVTRSTNVTLTATRLGLTYKTTVTLLP